MHFVSKSGMLTIFVLLLLLCCVHVAKILQVCTNDNDCDGDKCCDPNGRVCSCKTLLQHRMVGMHVREVFFVAAAEVGLSYSREVCRKIHYAGSCL